MNATLEDGATPVAAVIVSVMQDAARLKAGLLKVAEEIPAKVWNWLWFRRHILSIPERCMHAERYCHTAMSRSPWTVREEEFPEHVRGRSCTDPVVEDFEHDIEIFREWILSSSVVELLRHSGELAGELGLRLKKSCVHETVRGAVPGLAFEISFELREVIESLGYTSLLADRGKQYLLFGPLALLQSGQMLGMELGMVQGVIDWSKSFGTRLKTEAGIAEGVRLTKLKSYRHPKSDQATGGMHWNAGDELVVAYTPLMMGEYGTTEDAGKAEIAQEERLSDESRRQRKETGARGCRWRRWER